MNILDTMIDMGEYWYIITDIQQLYHDTVYIDIINNNT